MNLIAIETATEACSAALWKDGAVIERFEVAPRGHATLILPMIDALLAEAGIGITAVDALAFGRGPGSFTGVRVATGVIQGIAFARDLPVVPVSTLAALAQGAARTLGAEAILAAIDARMGEVYWGAFRVGAAGLVEPVSAEHVSRPEAVALPMPGSWAGAGTGWQSYGERLTAAVGAVSPCDGAWLPHAADTARLGAAGFTRGEAVAPGLALPVYLRDNVAAKPASG